MGPVLYSERYDEAYAAGATDAEVPLGNYTYDESWSGYALQRSSTITPFLVPGVDANGQTNLGVSGAIRFWFKPSWSSGTGPGVDVPLIEWTTMTYSQATVIWSLDVSADGTTLALLEPGSGGPIALLTNQINWQAGDSHLLTLDYGPGGTALFVDGELVAQGVGTPTVSLSAAQLSLGSTVTGALPAAGDFDELYCFGRAQTTNDVEFYYAAASGQAALGPVSDAEIEARQATFQAAIASRQAMSRFSAMSSLGGDFGTASSNGCVTGGQPYLTNLVVTTQTNQQMTVSFSIAGGTNGVPYEILTTTNLTNQIGASQWQWLAHGYTCNTYTFSNQPASQSFYALGPLPTTMVVAWGSDGSHGNMMCPMD